MSKTYLSSPRRRGSQSLNGINDLNIESMTNQVAFHIEALDTDNDLSPDPSPKERGAKPENSVTPLVPNNTLVPKLPLGNAISREASASHCETEFREHVVSQTGPPLADWDTGKSSVTLEEVIKPTLNIGLFGFGCVGQGLYDVLNHSQGLKASIGKICVKDKTKPRTIDTRNFTFNKHEVLGSSKHNLIVELTSDADAALEIITDSLAKGRSVVTAGKKVLAENFELLYRLQQQTGSSLLYEAACAGSIPIIRTLEEYYDNELLSSVRGILNGSSNYILSKMELGGLSYHDALKQAQLAGFAEADPALDVDGTDAKYKLCLLAAHAFGIIVMPKYIFNSGINNITPFDINYAAQNNCRIKLIAGIAKDNGGYRAYVLPKFISRDSPLSNINYEFNGIEVEGVYSDKQFFVGKGAGSHPTGSAVLSDISAITYDYKYGYKKLAKRNLSPRTRGSQSTNGEKNYHNEESFQTATLGYDTVPDPAKQKRGTSLCSGGVGATPYSVLAPACRNGSSGREEGEVSIPNFSSDHRLLARDFTIRLYIRYHDSHDCHDANNARRQLDLLDIRDVEEEYSSGKAGCNYIIANVGFESLFKLQQIPNDLFVCEV